MPDKTLKNDRLIKIAERKIVKKKMTKILYREIKFLIKINALSEGYIDFLKANFKNNPAKRFSKGELNKIKQYLPNAVQIQLLEKIKETEKGLTLDGFIQIQLSGLENRINGEEILLRKQLLDDIFEVAKYIKKKINKRFLKKETDDMVVNLLIKEYNYQLARLKFLFYNL